MFLQREIPEDPPGGHILQWTRNVYRGRTKGATESAIAEGGGAGLPKPLNQLKSSTALHP